MSKVFVSFFLVSIPLFHVNAAAEKFFKKIFIRLIEVTLVNKIMKLSGVQVYNTSSVYCTVCSPPKSHTLPSPFLPLYPHLPPLPSFPLVATTLLSGVLWEGGLG